MVKLIRSVIVATLVILIPLVAFAQNGTGEQPLRVALFIQDKTGVALPENIALLNDILTAKLTNNGFSIVDQHIVISKFREAGIARQNEEAFLAASATRIAKLLATDYLLVASISSIGNESREFIGEGTAYKTDNKAIIHTLRATVKVIDGNAGGSIYADTVVVTERTSLGQNVKIVSNEILNNLLVSAAENIATNVSEKILKKIRDFKTTAATVEFSVVSNVDGATIELDGVAIGSTPGKFMATAGIHQLRVSKQLLTTWERPVNILPQQTLNIILELSPEGLRHYTTIEQFKADLARVKIETEAAAYEKKAIADGEKQRRLNSYERIEIRKDIKDHNIKPDNIKTDEQIGNATNKDFLAPTISDKKGEGAPVSPTGDKKEEAR